MGPHRDLGPRTQAIRLRLGACHPVPPDGRRHFCSSAHSAMEPRITATGRKAGSTETGCPRSRMPFASRRELGTAPRPAAPLAWQCCASSGHAAPRAPGERTSSHCPGRMPADARRSAGQPRDRRWSPVPSGESSPLNQQRAVHRSVDCPRRLLARKWRQRLAGF